MCRSGKSHRWPGLLRLTPVQCNDHCRWETVLTDRVTLQGEEEGCVCVEGVCVCVCVYVCGEAEGWWWSGGSGYKMQQQLRGVLVVERGEGMRVSGAATAAAVTAFS
jgi:hypothetical protein